MPNPERERIRILHQQLLDRQRFIRDLLNSKSWKITHPFRWLHSHFTRVFGFQDNSLKTLHHETQPVIEQTFNNEAKDALSKRARTVLEFFLSSRNKITVPSSTEPKLSVLIVAFNRADLTLTCLLSLIENPPPAMEVIIVNNGSYDETEDLLNQIDGARIIHNNENMHFIYGANQASKEARGEYILFLNNDTQLLPGSIQAALKTIESSSDIGAVGGKLILPDGSLQEAGSIVWRDGSCAAYGRGENPYAPPYMFVRDTDFCSAAFLLTKREVFLSMGGFDESYKPAYYEDADYCLKLWKNKKRVVYDPKVALIHHEFGSTSNPTEAIQLQDNNRKVFVAKNSAALSNQPELVITNVLDARIHSLTRKKVLFIDDRVPHSFTGSGFPRAHAILLSLLRLDCFVSCYPMFFTNEDWNSVYSDVPQEIEVILNSGRQLLTKFLEERKGYYDVMIVSRPSNMEIVQQVRQKREGLFEKMRLIYDAEALFAVRDVALRRASGEEVSENELQKLVRNERSLGKNVDALLSTSHTERQTWVDYGSISVVVLGHCTKSSPTARPFLERKGFLFVGAIHDDISPNADAVRWFVNEIFPLIQKKLGGEIELTIAGVNNSESIYALASERIHIAGYSEDLTNVYDQSRVFVAPIRYSAGIPIKILHAASHGLPVVATSTLGLQLGWKNEKELLLADISQDFAENCIKLYNNSDLWQKIRENALHRITQDCSPEVFDRTLEKVLSA